MTNLINVRVCVRALCVRDHHNDAASTNQQTLDRQYSRAVFCVRVQQGPLCCLPDIFLAQQEVLLELLQHSSCTRGLPKGKTWAHRSVHCAKSSSKAALAKAWRRELVCVYDIRVAEVEWGWLSARQGLSASHDAPCNGVDMFHNARSRVQSMALPWGLLYAPECLCLLQHQQLCAA